MLLPLAPGQTGIKFVATPTPAGAALPAGATVSWLSHDVNVNAVPDPADPSGLTVDISIAAVAGIGEAAIITLLATGTNADGSALNATDNLLLFTVAPPPKDTTGFTFDQSV
jgi:hypothetical protein